MCYDIKVSLERQLKMAKHYGDVNAISEIEKKLLPLLNPIEREYYQVSGFSHPKLLVLNKSGIELSEWGLIPDWIGDSEKAKEIANQTLNAKVETLLEKPSFRKAVKKGRCVLFVDGFYEHHHLSKKTYPYYIFPSNPSELLPLAAIASSWINPANGKMKSTFSIVTTKANSLLEEIHNNPNLKEPRMPLILSDSNISAWLNKEIESESQLNEFAIPAKSSILKSHTVNRFKKGDQSNKKNASDEFHYPELGPTLFD